MAMGTEVAMVAECPRRTPAVPAVPHAVWDTAFAGSTGLRQGKHEGIPAAPPAANDSPHS